MSSIRDASLAPSGHEKIEWVRRYMPVLNAIGGEFARARPLKGLRVTLSIHLEAKTAWLACTLQAAGAEVAVTGCNPLSTQDDVAAALHDRGIPVYGWHGATAEQYRHHLTEALFCRPHLVLDDGGDLVSLLHGPCRELAGHVVGGCEETTTGVHRLRARARDGALRFPVMSVNDADCKYLFDNRYGTGQSVWDGIMNATNLLVAGKTVVVAGYGWCGRGVALRARGLGARVIVTEVNPVRALEAHMDGHEVMTMDDAAPLGDCYITVTGCRDVITARHMGRMKDGALLANAGHFDVEVNVGDLGSLAVEVKPVKPHITGYTMDDGRMLCLLAQGRLVNLAAGNGHPAEIMDMSFALQALCLEYMAKNGDSLAPGVYDIPPEIDDRVARLKLDALGRGIDALTADQAAYLAGWGEQP